MNTRKTIILAIPGFALLMALIWPYISKIGISLWIYVLFSSLLFPAIWLWILLRSQKKSLLEYAEAEYEEFRKNMDPRLEDASFTLRKIRENPMSMIGLSIIIGFAIIAILAPIITPPPDDPDNPFMIPHEGYSQIPKPPNENHPFGTTRYQYDIYYGVIWGTRTAFRIGILVVGGMIAIGIALGSIAGYYGGVLDEIIMRLVDIIIAVPAIVLAIVVVTVLGPDLDMVMIALIFAYWPYYARLIRGEILSVREEQFVEAAKASGSSNFRIITRHILPNSYQSVMVMATLDMGAMVIVAAALSFLGLGAPEGYASWGSLLNFSRDYITNPEHWFTHIFPGIFIFLYVLGWNLLADALRDVSDPRIRRR